MLGRFGVADRAREHPDRLSGGSNSVSRSPGRCSSPAALPLDEVTSALDPQLVGEVLTVIQQLKEDGMTMVIATHEMGFARDVADQARDLEAGRIIERGRPEQMFSAPQNEQTGALARALAGSREVTTRAAIPGSRGRRTGRRPEVAAA